MRARSTAQAVCDHVGLPLLLDQRLRETFFGQWQGMTGVEVSAQWPEEYVAWRAFRGGPVGGESHVQVGERAAAAVLEHAPAAGTLLAVTHGGTARAIAGRLMELDPSTWWRLAALGNTCWTTLVESERGWRLERHNTGLGPLLGDATGAR